MLSCEEIHDVCSLADPLEILRRCGGYYECPKDEDGGRLGPLVAYRGTYDNGAKRFVGDVYANWAKVEQYPEIAYELAERLTVRLNEVCGVVDVFCGAPEGGKHLADKLALFSRRRYSYPEKKTDQLVWGRHGIEAGEEVALVEDVTNNFTTTEEMFQLICAAEGTVLAIVTYLNRSPTVESVYVSDSGLSVPIVSLIRKPFPEYRQDDAAVADDIQRGNIVWSVKGSETWSQLEAAMARAES